MNNRFSSKRTNQKLENIRKFENVRKPKNHQTFVKGISKTNSKFIPQKPNFPNPSAQKATKVSYTKGTSEVETMNHWLENNGKKYQSGKFSQHQINKAYE